MIPSLFSSLLGYGVARDPEAGHGRSLDGRLVMNGAPVDLLVRVRHREARSTDNDYVCCRVHRDGNVDPVDPAVLAQNLDPSGPDGRPLRELTFDSDEIGGLLLEKDRAVDAHHMFAFWLEIDFGEVRRITVDDLELVIGRRQGRLLAVRCRLTSLLGLERCQEDFAANKGRSGLRYHLECEPMHRIQRRPHVHRRAHAPAACGRGESSKRAVLEQRVFVSREKSLEEGRPLQRRLLQRRGLSVRNGGQRKGKAERAHGFHFHLSSR